KKPAKNWGWCATVKALFYLLIRRSAHEQSALLAYSAGGRRRQSHAGRPSQAISAAAGPFADRRHPAGDAQLSPFCAVGAGVIPRGSLLAVQRDRKSTRLNSSDVKISYAVFCL